MPNPSHEIFSQKDKDKFRFWNTAPTDGRKLAGKAKVTYYPKGRDLMPHHPFPLPEHAGKTMKQVPLDYLRWVNQQPWAATWNEWQPIRDYIARFPIGDWIEPPETLIFVDPLISCVPTKQWKWDTVSHLTTQPSAEPILHAFAVGALGLSRDWFQPREYLAHYNLSPAKHAQAIAAGAKLLDTRAAISAHIAHHKTAAATERCRRSHTYATQAEANDEVNRRMSQRRNRPESLRAYECPICELYHLTTRRA